jgi:HEPN domain-containing protein
VHADEDLRLAKHALTLKSSCPYKLIAYHAQQCAEKYLKAYLVFKKIDFPYTHNISRLLELCPDLAEQEKDLQEAKVLTPYAITARYPGKGKVTKRNALQAIMVADNVRRVIRSVLKKEMGVRGLRLHP